MRNEQSRVVALAGKLESLSPLAVLGRGYSVTLRDRDGAVVRRAPELKIGETMTSRFASGSAKSTVTQVKPDD
jgi:exodeoxyribonuclease VII large subunit